MGFLAYEGKHVTSSYEKRLFDQVLRMVDAYECGLDTRVLLWIIYGEIDAKLYELDYVMTTMAKFKTDDMLKTITKEADFTSEVNKPLVEL